MCIIWFSTSWQSMADTSRMGKPEYRETFKHHTDLARVDEVRARIDTVVETFELRLISVDVIPKRRGHATMEITVIGTSKAITMLRETLNEIVLFSSQSGGGEDIADMIIGVLAGPVMDGTATLTRRGYWAMKRRRRGPANRYVSPQDAVADLNAQADRREG
jgi:hypothetical protein